MASDKVKDLNNNPEQAATEAKAALAQEASSKPAEIAKPATVASPSPKLELSISPELLKNAALKAEMKSQNLPTQTATKFDWSVVDTVTSVLKKGAEVLTTGGNAVLTALANPVVVGIGAGVSLGGQLVKVAEGMYKSADNKVTLNKVRGDDARNMKDDWDRMFNSDVATVKVAPTQTPTQASLEIVDPFKKPAETSRVSAVDVDKDSLNKDMLRFLFEENEKPQGVQISDNLFSYTDDKNKTTEISSTPGHVHIEKKDERGNVETIVDKTTGKTIVLHKGERVTIENGKQIIQGDGYKVSWDEQGKRHVFQNDGKEIIRDGNSVKLLIGGNTVDAKPGEVKIGSNVSILDSADELAKKTEEIRKTLKPEETYVMNIRNVGVRTIFGTGATFDVQHDRARLETPDHKVFQFKIENDQLLYKNEEGKYVPLDQASSQIKVENGNFKIGDLVIDPKEFCIKTDSERPHRRDGGTCKPRETDPGSGTAADGGNDGGCNVPSPFFNWNWRQHTLDVVQPDGKPYTIEVKPDNNVVIKDGTNEFETNKDDSKVKITTIPSPTDGNGPAVKPSVTTVDIKTTTVETDKVIDDPNKTFIKDTHTVIDKDRNVQFEDGPLVKPDGSVKVDKNTYVDKDMHVSSLGWESSAAQSNYKAPVNESNVQSTAISMAAKATSMYNLAKAGVVRWTEVASLNSALGDVLNLMSNVPVGSPAHAMLMRSYFLLVQAIIEATPKAQVAEKASDKEDEKNNKK